jgi:hypothetical protein
LIRGIQYLDLAVDLERLLQNAEALTSDLSILHGEFASSNSGQSKIFMIHKSGYPDLHLVSDFDIKPGITTSNFLFSRHAGLGKETILHQSRLGGRRNECCCMNRRCRNEVGVVEKVEDRFSIVE